MIENLTNKYHFNLNRDIPYIKKKRNKQAKKQNKTKTKIKAPHPPCHNIQMHNCPFKSVDE